MARRTLGALFRWLWHSPEPRASTVPVHYNSITESVYAPSPATVGPGMFFVVAGEGRVKWALFRCPCGCNDVITLSLQPVHRPHWMLRMEHDGTPTLYPSVFRDVGCRSHFCIGAGRVFWAKVDREFGD